MINLNKFLLSRLHQSDTYKKINTRLKKSNIKFLKYIYSFKIGPISFPITNYKDTWNF